jgi:uncharacterized lipoprotein NlpE involved in copper resistance
MSKLILTAACAAAALSLAGCNNEQANEANAMNVEETDNMMVDENLSDFNDMNMTNDMNVTDGNATGNAAVDNTTNAY